MVNIKNKKQPSDQTASPKNRLGYGYFIAAVIFLFNPCINIVDILPDFFGYVFLIKGLEKWADLCPNVADALQGLGKLRWFMLLKIPAILLIPILRDDTFVLLLTFCFILIELIYAIPAAGRIFDGLDYFGTRFDGKTVFKGHKDLRLLTNIFFIAKSALCLLPELCSLSSYEYSGYVTNAPQFDPAQYKGTFVFLGVTLSLLIGILWLVIALPYIIRISEDTPFLERVLHDYDLEITQNIGIALRRTLHTSTALFIAGFVFFLNIWIDGINVIPTFIGAIFLIAALIKLRGMSPVPSTSVAMTVIFAVISAISFAVSFMFSIKYDLRAITLGVADAEVYEIYNLSLIVAIAEYAMAGIVMYLILREMRRLIAMHLAPDPDIKDRRLIAIYEDHQRASGRSITAVAVLFAISLITNAAYILLRASIDTGYWLIPFIVTGIWLVYTVSTLWQLYDQIEYKYT
ncbi:MAG: hypothetical protein IJF48_02215 [Clostridia bacterium]|nr:hypothetical protein [Clostridia bacterium]